MVEENNIIGTSEDVNEFQARRIRTFFDKFMDNPYVKLIFKTSGTLIDTSFIDDVRSLSKSEVEYLCCVDDYESRSYDEINKMLVGKTPGESLTTREKIDRGNMTRRIDNLHELGFVEKIKVPRQMKVFRSWITVDVNAAKITEKGKLARMFHNPISLITPLMDRIKTLLDEIERLKREVRELRKENQELKKKVKENA